MIDILNFILDSATTFLTNILNLLPQSPFLAISNVAVAQWLPSLNWIIPITEIIAILQAWGAAVLVFYSFKIIMRWIKAI